MVNGKGQFNLIGYSYGSLLAAQTANCYANKGHTIDHLVLIGSPIDGDFLTKLRNHPSIAHVVVINLTAEGDDIYAGMPQATFANPMFIEKLASDMLSGKGEGHFYYGHAVPVLDTRLKELAKYIYSKGLR
ncbi:thioesterase domain-containing protein [Rhodoferax sp. GW822-FHT02A01]|uniref:thioesterase domain-containing protein n=1 Tax=Rhodoferax sp. GW822-FHT02A01 TaxID=3141537 RepID=UPI00315DC2E0